MSDGAAAGHRPAEDVEREFRMLIDGAWVDAESGETFSCVDPFTEEPWGRVPLAGPADVDRAVRAARRAFDDSGWPQTPAPERAALLRRLAALIETHAEELAYRQIRENGKLASEMVPGARAVASDCYFFAGLAETLHGMSVPVQAPNFVGYTMREPIGVVAAITPWNTPPIPGLYAAGEVTGVYYHEYPAGTSVLRSLTFGRLAGAQTAAESDR